MIQVHIALEALPPILGHTPEIRKVLTNLIFNSVDAMPQDGILTEHPGLVDRILGKPVRLNDLLSAVHELTVQAAGHPAETA